jgi:hypothetical protein
MPETSELARTSTGTRRKGKTPGRRPAGEPADRRWSRRVLETSNALDLEAGVFSPRSPRKIAGAKLSRSARQCRC